MKKILYPFLIAVSFIGCTKESVKNNTAISNTDSTNITGADAVIEAIGPRDILGDYNCRGSRTIFNGQANDAGDNIRLILDYFAVKQMTVAPDKQHLLLPYGEPNYMSKGWKYVIGYNFTQKHITVEPNDVMKAAIVPGSFESLYAAYSPRYKSWTFRTRFTALADNGNESEVIEPMGKAEE